MTERKHRVGQGKLPLPSPRSPRELDEKILAHARARAPQRKPALSMGMLGGLATACMIVVAVFITVPQQSPQAPVTEPSPARSQADMAVSSAIGKVEEVKEMPAAPSARMKMARSAGAVRLDMEAQKPLPEMALSADSAVMADEAIAFADDPLKEELSRLAALLEDGNIEQAREAYQKLRGDCPACNLPETLEQALQDMREGKLPVRP
jgi:hypothetical protein